MPIAKRRSRFVTFRLLQSEYDDFLGLCASEGARNLSDLARSALLRFKRREDIDVLQAKVDTLTEIVHELEREIKNLTRVLAGARIVADLHNADLHNADVHNIEVRPDVELERRNTSGSFEPNPRPVKADSASECNA